MHTFQPYPIDVLEFNPFTKIGSDWAVIVTEKDGRTNAMTASWGGVGVIWNKNVATIYIRESRFTKEFLDSTDTFTVNFFESGKMKSTMGYLGKVSGRDEDKLKAARLDVNYQNTVPFLDDANFVLVCKKLSASQISTDDFCDPTLADAFYADGDLHTMYIGEITEVLAR